MPHRVELSPEELGVLLGTDRFEPVEEAPAVAAPMDAPAAPMDAVQPPVGSARLPGDADLLQAVLAGAPNFEALLLKVIRERSGEPLARLVDGAVADAMVAADTGTRVDSRRALVAPLPPDVRNAWAAWAARWLELATLVAARAPKGGWDDPTGLPMWPRLRTQAAHRIAAARTRRESVHVAVLRIEDTDLWNRRSQVLVNDAFQARVAAELDQNVAPGDELARLEDGAFVLVTARDEAVQTLANSMRSVIAQLPGDGPRSLAVRVGVATAPWDATCPQSLLDAALRRAAAT